jgi:predicted thioredoxin/glutaredoxin
MEEALKELGRDDEIIRITDIEEMKKRGVMRVPVLFIDGEVKSAGSVPSVEDLKSMLQER